MSATTPTGPLSLPLVAVRTAITGAAAFASWIGPSVPPASRGYLLEEPADGAGEKYVVVDWGFQCDLSNTDVVAPATFEQNGTIVVAFRWRIPPGTTDEEATLQFLNFLGAIMPQVGAALWAAAVQLMAMRLIAGPERPDTEDRKREDLYEAVWQFEAKAWPA